jgi:hypothetical protein
MHRMEARWSKTTQSGGERTLMTDSRCLSPGLSGRRAEVVGILMMICFVGTMVPFTAAAGNLDLRAEYAIASGQYKSRVRIDQSLPAGLYAAMEIGLVHSNGLLKPLPDTIQFSGVEPELNKSVPFGKAMKGCVGAKYRWTDRGATFKPYLRFSTSLTPALKTTIGYRYERRLYETEDLNGTLNHDDIQRVEVASDWKATTLLRLGYNVIFYRKQNDYTFSNQQGFLIEQNIKLSLRTSGGRFMPYMEFGDVGDYINTEAGIHARQLRLRLGISIRFMQARGSTGRKAPNPPARAPEPEEKPGVD